MQILKDALPDYLGRYYGDRITKRSAGTIQMRCPFHEDKRPSFSANNAKGTWLYHCFSCGSSGSIIDLHAQANGLVAKSRENILSAAESVGVSLPDSRKEYTKAEKREWAIKQQAAFVREKRSEQRKAHITDTIQAELDERLAPYLSDEWQANLWHESPIRFDDKASTPHDFLRFLFKPDDVLWMGKPKESGYPRSAANFRTCAEWLKGKTLPERVGGGTFKLGVISRSKENVLTAPFILLESDDLIGHKPTTPAEKARNKMMCAALICYARTTLGLVLRAVLDTGNKSLHGLFDRPPARALEAVKAMAEGFRIDKNIIDCEASPLRMPLCIHDETGQPANLIYLNPIT